MQIEWGCRHNMFVDQPKHVKLPLGNKRCSARLQGEGGGEGIPGDKLVYLIREEAENDKLKQGWQV